MGWSILIGIKRLLKCREEVLRWLVIGGLAYSFSIYFFCRDSKVKYYNIMFHIFIILGTTSQAVAILKYI
jgi:channel protein (hemolysin III family)